MKQRRLREVKGDNGKGIQWENKLYQCEIGERIWVRSPEKSDTTTEKIRDAFSSPFVLVEKMAESDEGRYRQEEFHIITC